MVELYHTEMSGCIMAMYQALYCSTMITLLDRKDFLIFNTLAPCQWSSHPDSNMHKPMINCSMIIGKLVRIVTFCKNFLESMEEVVLKNQVPKFCLISSKIGPVRGIGRSARLGGGTADHAGSAIAPNILKWILIYTPSTSAKKGNFCQMVVVGFGAHTLRNF